jgi:hypothetical protein
MTFDDDQIALRSWLQGSFETKLRVDRYWFASIRIWVFLADLSGAASYCCEEFYRMAQGAGF